MIELDKFVSIKYFVANFGEFRGGICGRKQKPPDYQEVLSLLE